MHKRNLHKDGYNFDVLVRTEAALAKFVITNPNGRKTIDFANSQAVKTLNAALLKHYYGLSFWDIPKGYLCPPVPGRADYIHALADLLEETYPNYKTTKIKALDIGTGANLIYPIVGSQLYDWQFVASDIDKVALESAKLIQSKNLCLQNWISIRHQSNAKKIFDSVLEPSDDFAFCMCNPPFHTSAEAAMQGSSKKKANLKQNRNKRHSMSEQKPTQSPNNDALNFAGKSNELWCQGGEVGFIKDMIRESIAYQDQVFWFTSLVSKKDNLKPIYAELKRANVSEYRTVEMGQGNKISRFIAWRF
jgi:23S rRNA (adenine1618-N6)-methyltransferase